MSTIESYGELDEYVKRTNRRYAIVISVTAIALIAMFIVCMMVGNYVLSPTEVINALLGNGDAGAISAIKNVRLPRVISAALVGAALSIAGLSMQSLFKNPMASPSILGISSGAAFGASLAISFGIGSAIFGNFATPAMAFIMCFVTLGLVYLIGKSRYGVSNVTLILAGVAIGAFFNGLVSMMQYIADENTLAEIVFWTMGSFNKVTWSGFQYSAIPMIIGIVALGLIVRELNLVSAGEEQAANLGVNVKRTRIIAIIGTAFCVGGAVSLAGTIGFVGLIIPHVFRMLVGPNHKILIPLCLLGGALFLMTMDTLAKMAFVMSFPVGVLTSLLGAPFFIFVLKKRKKDVWE
jgi:iron complex transport system permease protein